MVDLIIIHGTIITMDPQRRVIEDGSLAMEEGRMLGVGTTAEITDSFSAGRVIDASKKIVMPGLMDGHSHAGHGLIKSLGIHNELWRARSQVPGARAPQLWGHRDAGLRRVCP